MDFNILSGIFFSLGIDGLSVDENLKEFLRNTCPACVVLFKRNIESPEQTADLIREIKQTLSERPPLISIDFEGGRVNRLVEFIPEVPSAARLGSKGDHMLLHRFGEISGRLLSILGIDVNYAPVADYFSEISREAIGDRAFSEDIAGVKLYVKEYLEGLSGEGVAGCIKHFPGLGASNVDSHLELPVDNRPVEEIRNRDMLPYRQSFGFPYFVMVSHAAYPTLSGNSIPASLNPAIYRILRSDVGFMGIALTDDLVMGALKNQGDISDRCHAAFDAGADGALICKGMKEAEEAVERFRERYRDDSAAREKMERIFAKYELYKKEMARKRADRFDRDEFNRAVEEMTKLYRYVVER